MVGHLREWFSGLDRLTIVSYLDFKDRIPRMPLRNTILRHQTNEWQNSKLLNGDSHSRKCKNANQ